jgi:hypothetical protein
MKTLDGTLYRRALDCSGPQSAHTRVVPRAGGQSPLWVIRYPSEPAASPAMSAVAPKAEVNSERRRSRYGPLRVVSASSTRLNDQLGNATVGAAEPPAKFAVDVLHHDHIAVDVGLVVRVEISGRELVQYGCALGYDGG